MILTTENAHKYVGKYIIGKLWHHWPLKVKQLNDGRYAVVDSTDTMMLVPDKKDKFNAIYFDKAFKTKEEAEKALGERESKKLNVYPPPMYRRSGTESSAKMDKE